MDTKLFYLTASLLICGCQAFSQSVEVVANGVASLYRMDGVTALHLNERLDFPFYDWQAPDEEIATGLWIAKLFSRYQLSVPLKDKNGASVFPDPVEIPVYPPSDFSIEGVVYTNFHIRITLFIVYGSFSTNSLKCILASYFQKSDKEKRYVYSVYVNLNTGVGGLYLKSGSMMPIHGSHAPLPLLSGEDLDRQKMFILQRDTSRVFDKPRMPRQLDDDIEIQTDL